MKTSRLFLLACLVLLMAPVVLAQNPYSGRVLYVEASPPYGSDSLTVRELEYMGFTVDRVTPANVDSLTAYTQGTSGTYKFIYVSSTVSSGACAVRGNNTPGKWKLATCPVLMMEGKATDEMGMTLLSASTQSVQDIRVRPWVIQDPTDYLAAGLSDTVVWCDTSMVPDSPNGLYCQNCLSGNGGVQLGFTTMDPGDPVDNNGGALYYYEKGKKLADGTYAAGRRYYAAFYDNGFRWFTAAGLRLWTAMINWACYLDQNPAYSGRVLYVEASPPYGSDSLTVRQLEYMGFTVDRVTPANVDSLTAYTQGTSGTYKFIYVSSTVSSGACAVRGNNTPGKWRLATCPVLMMEGKATDEMGMTLLSASTQAVQDIRVRPWIIQDPTDYLAAGLADTVVWCDTSTVPDSPNGLYCQNCLCGNAGVQLGYTTMYPGDPVDNNGGALYYYEKGKKLADGTYAAGRRYYAAFYDNGFRWFTAAGFKLWTAMINWAIGFDQLTGIDEIPGPLPVEFALNQNYPNPFNPATVISFSVAAKAHVRLNVFNLLGQKVASLVDEHMNPGSFEVRFDATGLSSGIYFYSLSTDSRTITKKMILLR